MSITGMIEQRIFSVFRIHYLCNENLLGSSYCRTFIPAINGDNPSQAELSAITAISDRTFSIILVYYCLQAET